MIAPNAFGNAVQRTTRMKISQTWLASQTGVRECWISTRGRSPLSAFPAEQVPEAAAEVGAAEERVGGHPGPEDDGGDVRLAHLPTSATSAGGP